MLFLEDKSINLSWNIESPKNTASKKYAIPEMFINAVLDDCAKNTQYFGLCQITGDRCDVRFAPPSVIAARAKELEMRQHEVVE